MFGLKKNITITIKLFGGLDADAGIEGYDPGVGIALCVTNRVRLGKAVKKIGLIRTDSMAMFINGNLAGPKQKLNDGDVIFCMRPLAGG
ncbi:MAG: hypothetical protein H8D87_00305 [Deltaproteobacteria bacterium]|uniref:hypothetical protein n=1 Tax=Desulfobacula sp. TaxID=2593537 RepID=UPI00198F2574|nr:hypothetical protein [Candidatus Desulfobacula maris]MBL6994289.1 hypothetical protein [Desulfobacula sp.]